ncbi:gluconate 2-dehydrogenase subunit 3 family protein [Pedobacter metabolipauper]|uniref:Gluconate 2-dehydrogenase subunit 3-like protein n=1 Tax=Pedobacter metabolipauper TaxID=425513 RepID=A0A4V3D1D6_9SPHI|nr:gluconate 2-dehydrogenase subunit 3 family protein [Pedobacter metabolipauper]TDQ10337.1 gluconate 2-dehydrogenase subunit 3-like protein [Pedobacter metabolipauper]
MDRRAAVKNMAFLMGGALSATTIGVFLDSCNSPSTPASGSLFTENQLLLITGVADLIIPTTSTPGAKAAGVGPFIALMIKDCYPADAQKAFVKGLEDLEKQSKDKFSKAFLELSPDQHKQIMDELREKTLADLKVENDDLERKRVEQENDISKKSEKDGLANSMSPKAPKQTLPRFFPIIRDLTILGYFTSEIGATKAMAFVEIPGRYDGCTDLKPGQKVWS